MNEEALVSWDDSSREDLLWWSTEGRFEEGVSLVSRLPDQMFWSDASDQGWGAVLSDQYASGIWSEEEALLSINMRELLAVERGLLSFQDCVRGCVVAVFCDNTTAVSYLRCQGGLCLQPSTQWLRGSCVGRRRWASSCVLSL